MPVVVQTTAVFKSTSSDPYFRAPIQVHRLPCCLQIAEKFNRTCSHPHKWEVRGGNSPCILFSTRLLKSISSFLPPSRPFKCNVCTSAFKQQHTLTQHLRTHSKERPYKCEVCPNSFMQMISLKAHMQRVHNKENPFKCVQCDKSFGDEKGLGNHKLKMHDHSSVYVCDMCCVTVKGKAALRVHMRRHREVNKSSNGKWNL